MRKKLKDTGGFSFVEMLCAVAILVLLCLMMNTGMTMAVRSYQAITAESEAELLVSSISDALADKLRYCVVTESTTGVHTLSIGEVEVVGGKVVVKETDEESNVISSKALLPDGAYGEGTPTPGGYIGKYMVTKAKDDDDNELPLVTYDSVNNSFTVKFTVTAEKAGISRKADFTVRCLNPVQKEE